MFLFLLICGASIWGVGYAQDDWILWYLYDNSAYSEWDGNLSYCFSILDEEIGNNVVFLAGERHATEKNQFMKMELIKYLNNFAGIRYVIDESGYTSAQMINRYLRTGDEYILKRVYRDKKGAYSYTEDEAQFYRDLREYNMTLDQDKRIELVGIDVEHQLKTAFFYIESLVQMSCGDDEEWLREKVKGINRENASAILKDFNENRAKYRGALKENEFHFGMALDNIVDSIKMDELEGNEFFAAREDKIYDNFKRIYGRYPDEKYFGQWGYEHVYKNSNDSFLGEIERLAMRMNTEFVRTKGRVVSLRYEYLQSYSVTKGTYEAIEIPVSVNNPGTIEKAALSEVNIFKIDGDDSPLQERNYFVKGAHTKGDVNYYDYLVVMRNSGAVKEFGKKRIKR